MVRSGEQIMVEERGGYYIDDESPQFAQNIDEYDFLPNSKSLRFAMTVNVNYLQEGRRDLVEDPSFLAIRTSHLNSVASTLLDQMPAKVSQASRLKVSGQSCNLRYSIQIDRE